MSLAPRSARAITGPMMSRSKRVSVAFVAFVTSVALGACSRAEPGQAPAPSPEPGPGAATAPTSPPVGSTDCASLRGDNVVQTEMRKLECTLYHAVVAIGRDDLGAIAPQIHRLHAAKEDTQRAIETGAWKPAQGDVAAFVALDDTFHRELEALVSAAIGGDHAGVAAALGRVLGQCQGCHAAFRPAAPAAPAAAHDVHAH
jgi:hypothetical protein